MDFIKDNQNLIVISVYGYTDKNLTNCPCIMFLLFFLALAEDILFGKFWLVRLTFERLGNVFDF